MPHKVGKSKWRWGNIERSSKEDLRRTVYGIWIKNGERGSFSKFWKTGKVDEDETSFIGFPTLVAKKVSRSRLPSLLDEIETYVENERFCRDNFEKYLTSDKYIDGELSSMYYGLFDHSGKCLALSYLNKVPAGCVLVAEIQCIFHGYGRKLLEDIFGRSEAIWLAANPDGGESLLEYYRSFELEETVLANSKWVNGKEEHFFFKASGKPREKILDFIKKAKV